MSINDELNNTTTTDITLEKKTQTLAIIDPILDPKNDRNTILPIIHTDIWNLYKKHESAIWHANEIKLDVDVRNGLARARSRQKGNNHFDERDLDFHSAVREGYREFFSRIHDSYVKIDANQPLDNVIQAVLANIPT